MCIAINFKLDMSNSTLMGLLEVTLVSQVREDILRNEDGGNPGYAPFESDSYNAVKWIQSHKRQIRHIPRPANEAADNLAPQDLLWVNSEAAQSSRVSPATNIEDDASCQVVDLSYWVYRVELS
ncbi:Uncharacterized protein TCM_044646 [Theobroma cacao]|uniref:Uncharacterized protein n=1 Tax=Theobroma cacao TaxID=3641 RepID=A0A061FR20_THECC|nr:Uncharacterized protein TCM_044646 [Theobroma cacao]